MIKHKKNKLILSNTSTFPNVNLFLNVSHVVLKNCRNGRSVKKLDIDLLRSVGLMLTGVSIQTKKMVQVIWHA